MAKKINVILALACLPFNIIPYPEIAEIISSGDKYINIPFKSRKLARAMLHYFREWCGEVGYCDVHLKYGYVINIWITDYEDNKS